MTSHGKPLDDFHISKVFSKSRSLAQITSLELAIKDLEDITNNPLDSSAFEHEKTTARRERVWQRWLAYAEKLSFDAHQTLLDLRVGEGKAVACCHAFLKHYAQFSTVWRPCLGPEEWREVRTVNTAVTLEDVWAALVQGAEQNVFLPKRAGMKASDAAFWHLTLSSGRQNNNNPADAVAKRIPFIARDLGLTLKQTFVKREASEQDILILLHTLWSKAEFVRCEPHIRVAVRNAILLQGIGGFRPSSVLKMTYQQVTIGWYKDPTNNDEIVLAATITVNHVKIKTAKIQRDQRDSLTFTITFVPCGQICILSSLLAQALSDNAFRDGYSSFSEICPPDCLEPGVGYVSLPWKEDMLSEPIIPCSYHAYNNIWHRLYEAVGVRSGDETRPYAMRVGAGNRLSGTLTQCLSNFIMNHSTAVFERSYQAVHTQAPLMGTTFGSLAGDNRKFIAWTSSALSRCDDNAPLYITKAALRTFHERNDMKSLKEALQSAESKSEEAKKLQERITYILKCLEKLQLASDRREYFEAADTMRAAKKSTSKLIGKQLTNPRKQRKVPSSAAAIRIASQFSTLSLGVLVDRLTSYIRNEPDIIPETTATLEQKLCLLCQPNRSFATLSSLNRHTSDIHHTTLSSEFHCPECLRHCKGDQPVVEGYSGWSRHVMEHHSSNAVPNIYTRNASRHLCPLCKQYFSARGFRRHYSKMHQSQQSFPFNCPLCLEADQGLEALIKNDDGWRTHMIDMHGGDKSYPYAAHTITSRQKSEDRDSEECSPVGKATSLPYPQEVLTTQNSVVSKLNKGELSKNPIGYYDEPQPRQFFTDELEQCPSSGPNPPKITILTKRGSDGPVELSETHLHLRKRCRTTPFETYGSIVETQDETLWAF